MDIRKFDVRVVRRYIDAGLLTLDEFEKELAALPDLSAHAVRIDTTMGGRTESEFDTEDGQGTEADA